MRHVNQLKVVFAGGGTGGSVTPLLAVAKELLMRYPQTDILFVGTSRGPEQDLVANAGLPFEPVTAGKLRRYFSFQNAVDLFRTLVGVMQAYRKLRAYRPDLIVSAGSYVAVPVVWAGWLLGIPSLIHQQDIRPGLANRLCAPWARQITVAFEQSLKDFPRRKTQWVGNPIRTDLFNGSRERGRERFGLHRDLPVILAFGGGTGALRLNQLIAEVGLDLVKRVQILHITGGRDEAFSLQHSNYHAVEFLTFDMADAYAVADMVVCRAGLSTLTELAALRKPAIVIPLPNTHQEDNAAFFHQHHAILLEQESTLTGSKFRQSILQLVDDERLRRELVTNISMLAKPRATAAFVDVMLNVVGPASNSSLARELTTVVSDVRERETLSRHTNFRIGGPADIFAVCTTVEQIVSAVHLLRQRDVRYTILGGGANVVVADVGIRGVVLQFRNAEFSVLQNEIIIGAGMNTGAAVSQCLRAGFVGLEFLVGIYGTVGGAVRGNAGSFGKEMRDVVVSVDVVSPDGQREQWDASRCAFGYRDSAFKHQSAIILSVHIRLERGDTKKAQQAIREYTSYKRAHQPLNYPSAGCMFKNHLLGANDERLRQRFNRVIKGNTIPAWALIAEAGLAGRRIGGIGISDLHANFFLNYGNGTAEEIVMLASLVKQQVRDQFGVQLQEEVQYLGFTS